MRAEQAFVTALADMPAGFPEALFASVKRGFEQRMPRLLAAAD
jgi:serine/threonine-protein kinase HipA